MAALWALARLAAETAAEVREIEGRAMVVTAGVTMVREATEGGSEAAMVKVGATTAAVAKEAETKVVAVTWAV